MNQKILNALSEDRRKEIELLNKVIEAMFEYNDLPERKMNIESTIDCFEEHLKDLIYDAVIEDEGKENE